MSTLDRSPLDRLAEFIIYFARRHYERIFLFFGVLVAFTAIFHALWVMMNEPALSNGHAPIPAIDSGDQPLPASAASAGQLAPEGSSVFRIMLPERYRGCWQGVAVYDSQQQLSDQWPAVKWLPKNYRLCFVEQDPGVWQLQYSENHIDAKDHRTLKKEHTVESLEVEGATALLHAIVVLGSLPGKYTTHEETTLHCELAKSPGSLMQVNADVVADVNGQPWCAARWHASFARAVGPAHPPRRKSES